MLGVALRWAFSVWGDGLVAAGHMCQLLWEVCTWVHVEVKLPAHLELRVGHSM